MSHMLDIKSTSPCDLAKFLGIISPKTTIAIDAKKIPIEKPRPPEKLK
jgi:hypothetical protein